MRTAVGNVGYRVEFNVYEDRTPSDDNNNNTDNEEIPANTNDIIQPWRILPMMIIIPSRLRCKS